MKLRFSLRFEASVQSGIWGCISVRMNCTAPLSGVSVRGDVTVRGDRGFNAALEALRDAVYGETGIREESCAFRSFSMKGVGPPAPAQKST